MKKKSTLNPIDRTRKAKRRYFAAVLTCVLACAVCTPAFAAGEDPLTAINNLSTFVFSAIKAIGVILLGWGVVQIGLSLQSHDPSQRSTGFLTFFGNFISHRPELNGSFALRSAWLSSCLFHGNWGFPGRCGRALRPCRSCSHLQKI